MPVNEILSTVRGPGPSGLSAWRECVKHRLMRGLEISTSSVEFRTELRALQLGSACLWALSSDPQRLTRTRPAGHHSVHVGMFILEGIALLQQGGRTCELTAGSFAFLDAAQPMTVEHHHAFEELYFQFPKRALPADLFQKAVAVKMSANSLVDRPLLDCVNNIWSAAPSLEPHAFAAAADALVSLSLMTSAFRQTRSTADPVAVRVRRAMDYIEEHLGDADLSAECVAAAQNVSRRYLDELFAKKGHRVDSWIWERRLQRAASELAVSSGTPKTLLRIALDLGFKDPSHFSRKYSRRYGLCPSQYRRTRAATPAS